MTIIMLKSKPQFNLSYQEGEYLYISKKQAHTH